MASYSAVYYSTVYYKIEISVKTVDKDIRAYIPSRIKILRPLLSIVSVGMPYGFKE